jgi:hypothetical protein
MPGLILASCPGLERAGQVPPVRTVYGKERIALSHLGMSDARLIIIQCEAKELKIRKKDAF